jgi:hypothetical protein
MVEEVVYYLSWFFLNLFHNRLSTSVQGRCFLLQCVTRVVFSWNHNNYYKILDRFFCEGSITFSIILEKIREF